MPTDPVQVVAEALRISGGGPRHPAVSGDFDLAADCAVAALRDAGLLAEGEVVGYAVLQFYDDFGRWERSARSDVPLLPFDEITEEVADLRKNYGHETFRVAALHLLPEEPSE
jgi:hypothetical protein